MNIKKLFKKYAALLLVFIGIVYFAQPYGLKLYFYLMTEPVMGSETVNIVQSVFSASRFLLGLILAIFILVDSKQKQGLDWLIVIITVFSVETGIILFLVWQIYKELSKRPEESI